MSRKDRDEDDRGWGSDQWEHIEGHIDSKLAVVEERLSYLLRRLDKMDDERTWLVRLVLGVVVAAVLGIVINKGGLQ